MRLSWSRRLSFTVHSIASIGLALATWIKRQSRAIATSVAIAVMLIAGWPILVWPCRLGMSRRGNRVPEPRRCRVRSCRDPVMRLYRFAGEFSDGSRSGTSSAR